MKRTIHPFLRLIPVLLLLLSILSSFGCASHGQLREQAPPILSQDELLRPYYKVGTIEVRRSRYGSHLDLTPADYNWAKDALRAEGARIGADAVILPEYSVDLERYIFFPVSEMKAKGIAIKFR